MQAQHNKATVYEDNFHSPFIPYSSQNRELPTMGESESSQYKGLLNQIQKWKKRVSRLRVISRMFSAIINIIMFAFMALVLTIFLSTRHEEALGRPIWPRDPKPWPTILLLTASLVTMLASVAVLLYYCLCFKRAVDSWKVIAVSYGIHIGLWLVVTFLYRYEKVLSDLWGWSCSAVATELQANGNINVDFAKLCRIQTAAWVFSLIETSLNTLFSICVFFAYMKINKVVRAKQYLTEGVGEGALGLLNVAF